jgi:hypothetical protein
LTAPLLLALGGALVFVTVRAPLRAASVTLLVALIVVPESLPLPLGPGWLALSRLVLYAFAASLLLRIYRREAPVDLLRPTSVHLVFAGFIAVAFLDGIVLAPQPNPRFESLLGWLTLADQLVVLVVAVAIARAFGPWWVARAIAVLTVPLVLIAFAERYLDFNWNHLFFQATDVKFAAGSAGMDVRGGAVRVRGPSQFALEFGWICALLVPCTLVVATRVRSTTAKLLPGLVAMASVWTVSRSSVLGIGAGALVTMLGARDMHISRLTLVGAAFVGIVLLQGSTLADPYAGASPDSAASRVRRIVAVTAEVEQRPLVGLGIAGPRARGVYGTDTSYVLLYAQLGVIGITMFGVLLASVAGRLVQTLRGPPSDDRVLGGAVIATLVAALIGTASFDFFSIAGSTRILWLIVGAGLVLAERRPRPVAAATAGAAAPGRRRWPLRAGAVGVAVAVGVVLARAAPTHVVWAAEFDTVPAGFTVRTTQDPAFIGRVLIDTTCETITAVPDLDVKIECSEPRQAPTIGELRIEGADQATTRHAVTTIAELTNHVLPVTRFYPTQRFVEGRPTWATSAPVWLGLTALAAAVLVPPVPRRRSRRGGEGADRADATRTPVPALS